MVDIRLVEETDLDVCYAIEQTCFPASVAATREQIEKRIHMFPEGFLVAEMDGQIVGMLNSGATNKDDITDVALKHMVGHESNGKNIVIYAVAVLPEHQMKGIARQLVNLFIEQARYLGKEQILLICKSSLTVYYATFGFEERGQSKADFGGFEWYEMALTLKDVQ